MNELHTVHRFERLCLVGHSMGGVIVREALNLHRDEREGPFVRSLVTIASPLGGHPAAAQGVNIAPAVVPAWRSLVPGSDFVRRLYRNPLPEETEYALYFAFDGQSSGDGVVPLSSQLRPEAQAEALRARGFSTTHTGVLRDAGVIAALADELTRCRGAEAR